MLPGPTKVLTGDVSKGTFYYHFEAKRDIIYAYVSDATDSVNDIKRGQQDGEISNRASAEDLYIAYSAAITGTGLDWACHDGNYNKIAMEKKIFKIIFSV